MYTIVMMIPSIIYEYIYIYTNIGLGLLEVARTCPGT